MKSLKLSICDEHTAHCEACRDEVRGPDLWAKLKVFAFDAEPSGRPVCPKKRAMGWKRPKVAAPAPSPAKPRVSLRVAPEVAAARLAKCNACPGGHNIGGICRKAKERHPTKSASIATGVWLPHARCPLDPREWDAAEPG